MLKTSNIPLTLIRCSFENKYLSKDLLFLFNEIGIEKPQIKNPWNTLFPESIDYPAELFCFNVNVTTISSLKEQHGRWGDIMLKKL